MKITLGGKISLALALLCANLWVLLVFVVPPDSGTVQEIGGHALYVLAFPLGWFSGLFSGGHGPSSRLYSYLLLTIPNSLLLGHCIAGLLHALRRVCKRAH